MSTEDYFQKNEMKTTINSTQSTENWNWFLNRLEDRLSGYDKLEEKFINLMNTYKYIIQMHYIRNIMDLELFAKGLECYDDFVSIKSITVNDIQWRQLWNILENYSKKTQYNCTLSQMIVQGFNIKLNDVVNHPCWSTVKEIQIFALNKIFIDCDVIEEGIQLSIFALTWESIGMHRIVLNGSNGGPHNETTALGYGKNGEAGIPGGDGGHFIGVGQHFINATNLRIEANGGNGGPGQNGANG